MTYSVFFGTDGLTSTSANHIANLAKEYVQGVEQELKSMNFFDTAVTLIGSMNSNKVEAGKTNDFVESIPTKLNNIIQAKSLIAWLREAIKAREALLKEASERPIEVWAEENNVSLPEMPERRKTLTSETAIEQLNIKDRNRYYALQTRCAVVGKLIHPDGALSRAREEMKARQLCDCKVSEGGRDTLIYTYKLTADIEKVDETFFKLQSEHRKAQAEFNGIAHSLTEMVEEDKRQADREYRTALEHYRIRHEEIETQFQQDQDDWRNQILANTKIVLPKDLLTIYNTITNL